MRRLFANKNNYNILIIKKNSYTFSFILISDKILFVNPVVLMACHYNVFT